MTKVQIPKTVIGVSEYFLNSLGYEFPEELKEPTTSLKLLWNLVQEVDKASGSCYLAWCENNFKFYANRHSLHEFLNSTEQPERCFKIDDWVCYLPWFRTSRKYGVVIDIRDYVNHKPGPFPLVRWLDDDTVFFTSGDFAIVVPKPTHLIERQQPPQGVQLSLFMAGEVLV